MKNLLLFLGLWLIPFVLQAQTIAAIPGPVTCKECDPPFTQLQTSAETISFSNVNSILLTQPLVIGGSPAKSIVSISAFLAYMEFVPASAECLACSRSSASWGNFVFGTFAGTAAPGGGTHELALQYGSLQPPGSYGAFLQVSLPPLVRCCEGTVRFCVRYTVTFSDCTVCHKQVCYERKKSCCHFFQQPKLMAMRILRMVLPLIAALLAATGISAQSCPPCPDQFGLQDSGCTHIRFIKSTQGFSASDTIHACQGSTVSYTLTAGVPGCSYPGISYTVTVLAGGTLLGNAAGVFTIQWGNLPSGMLQINYSYSNGAGIRCDGILFVAVQLTPKPVASFTAAPNPACFNNPTTITFNSNASVNALNYFWDFGDGFQATGPNPMHNYSAPGSYVVTLVVSAPAGTGGGNGSIPGSCPECTDTAQLTVVINNLPGPPITCVGTVCADETATYCTTASGCATYTWTIIGGVPVGPTNGPCITVLWGNGNPQGSINLQVSGCPTTYCSQGTTVNVPIVPPSITQTAPVACVNTAGTYSIPTWPGVSYSWTLSGGGTITSFNTNTPSVSVFWNTPGTWILTCNYYDSSGKCGGVATISVTVRPQATITGPVKICAGNTVTLNCTIPPATPVSSAWSLVSGVASFVSPTTGSSVTLTSATAGVFTVQANPGAAACNNPTFSVTVLPKPVLGPITGRDSICPGATYIYAVSSNSTGMFTWTAGNGTFVNLGTFNDSVQVTWGASGPYTLSVFQVSAGSNCPSNPQTFTAFAYPSPLLSGSTTVCADAVVGYTISNIGSGPFTWYISPANLGTIISNNGNSVQIKWHGSTNPGSTNTAWLHFGRCSDDSVQITITEPSAPVFTQSGSLCGGGVSLGTNATGSFSWTGPGGYSSNAATAAGITLPGIYTVVISNYNGAGCTVTASYNVPDIGRPVAHISASGPLNYCLPNVPNMNLVAASGAGYSFAWYQVVGMSNVPVGTNSPTLPINTLTAAGSYTFFCIVSLNGCSLTSNYLTINISSNCAGCNGNLLITGITGCNPFTITVAAGTPPGGSVVPGTTSISYTSGPTTSGNTTITFDSVGYQQISVCADIMLPNGSITRCCKDTVVLVRIAPKFLLNKNCSVVTLTDLSTVIVPCFVGSYNWTAGSYPGNGPLSPGVANFNNNTTASPVLTFTVSGTYVITQTITGCGCTASYQDTVTVAAPNASFSAANSCVGTPVLLSGGAGTHYWDFGDAATSYSSPTAHAYASAGTYTISHTVTDASGCTDTQTQNVTIAPRPTCNISYAGPLAFCAGNSITLNGCAGLAGYQWYNNGVPVGTGSSFTAIQTGNYWFTASNANNCSVLSDTVSVIVNAAPPAGITASSARCLGAVFTMSVPGCATCTYQWSDNGNPLPALTGPSGTFTIGPAQVGTHSLQVIVTNTITGCTATGTLNVTFYNPPTVSISIAGSPAQLCSGNVYVLTATSNAASPSWAWNHNGGNFVLSVLPTINASAAGTYNVTVTDGVTGCTASAAQVVQASPDLILFPTGCDTLCDTSRLFLPLASIGGNLAGYTITWYANAPPYTNVIGSGPSISLNALLPGPYSISVIVQAPNGCADTANNYSITVKPCGNTPCSCKGGTWDTLYWQPAGPIDGRMANVIITPVHAIKCGDSLGVIDCKQPIQVYGSWACQPAACDSAVSWQLMGPVTLSGFMPFSTAGLPVGSYVLTMIGKCGDSVCNRCKITFSIACAPPPPIDCCKGSYWKKGPLWIDLQTGASTPIDCANGSSLFVINAQNKNCTTAFQVQGTWTCADTCASWVQYQLLDSAGNVLLTSTNSLSIPANLANGLFTIVIQAYCGGKLCQTCRFKVRKDCKCDCVQSQDIQATVTINSGIPKKYKCNEKLPDVNCKDSVLLQASYNCSPATCPSAMTYQLNGPGGTSTGVLPLALNTLAPGAYTIMLQASCNGKFCRECGLSFTVTCTKIPICCPKPIAVQAGVPSVAAALPDSNATLVTQPFTFSGITGLLYTQVRAEVLSYELTDNYERECISCTQYPFTWASISTGTPIGAIPPAVGLFGGTTVPVFTAAGTGVYQNPRVVSWSSTTPFAVGGPVSIQFYLPPLPKIDCCVLKAKVCIRFTFRDAQCHECSVISCFSISVAKDGKGYYVLR